MNNYLYQMEPVFDEKERAEVVACLDSTWILQGKRTQAFERGIAEYAGATYAVAVPSCTVAMAVSLMALGIGAGDEVLVPDLTFVATANAVNLAGATPVLVDVDPETQGIDPHKLAEAITPRTKAVLPVWLNGHNPNIEEVVRVARRCGLLVVEDAACALGSWVNGRHAGTFGQMGCISFNTTKIITTGMGGMILTNDEALYERALRLKNHGRVDRRDHHPMVGYNFYFSDLLAALGIGQLQKLEERVAWKHQLCHWYADALAELPQVQTRRPAEGICPWYPDIFVDDPVGLKTYLEEQKIQTRLYYPAIHTQPAYSQVRKESVAQQIASRGLWLPSAAYVDETAVARVCAHIKDWCLQTATLAKAVSM